MSRAEEWPVASEVGTEEGEFGGCEKHCKIGLDELPVMETCHVRHLLLMTMVKTWPTASKKKNLVFIVVLTSITTLAAITANRPMMFMTRMPLRMM